MWNTTTKGLLLFLLFLFSNRFSLRSLSLSLFASLFFPFAMFVLWSRLHQSIQLFLVSFAKRKRPIGKERKSKRDCSVLSKSRLYALSQSVFFFFPVLSSENRTEKEKTQLIGAHMHR